MSPEDRIQIRALQSQIETLEENVAKLTNSVEDLVKAWNTAKGMTSFVKWIASLASAGGVIWALLQGSPK